MTVLTGIIGKGTSCIVLLLLLRSFYLLDLGNDFTCIHHVAMGE